MIAHSVAVAIAVDDGDGTTKGITIIISCNLKVPCKSMEGVMGFRLSPCLSPFGKNSRRNTRSTATISWSGGGVGRDAKPPKRGASYRLTIPRVAQALKQGDHTNLQVRINLHWLTRVLSPGIILCESRGAPLYQCCCITANFVSFKSHTHEIGKHSRAT